MYVERASTFAVQIKTIYRANMTHSKSTSIATSYPGALGLGGAHNWDLSVSQNTI